jgi:phage gp36-like protein
MSYATYADFVGIAGSTTGYGLPAASLGECTQTDVERELSAASATMDEHFAQWNLPLISWPENFVQRCCHIAAYNLIAGGRGYNGAASEDSNIKSRHDAAMVWLDKIQRRALQPYVTQATSPVVYQESNRLQPAIESRPVRGWNIEGGFLGGRCRGPI